MGDYLYARDLGTGRSIWVVPLTYGRARIHVGPTDSLFYDDGW